MKQQKTPFIQGFKQPTLTKNSFIDLGDIRGDGQGKLIIWSDQQNQLIVYKGSNREIQKPSKIKNVSGIITYFDQERNPKAVIGLSAQNGLYIFRSLNQSFRLRLPDIFAKQQQQILWSQYENDPDQLSQQLSKLPKKVLSQTARHFLSATTTQRKLQLIQKVFSEGINQKDSISAMCNLRPTPTSIGNIILGTQLNRLYILDSFGHSIIQQKIINHVPIILLAYGSFSGNYLIVSINRQGEVSFYMKNTHQDPQQRLKLSSRVVSADLLYPDLIICTQDQVISHFIISNSNAKIYSKRYSFKLPKQPIKILLFEYKSLKISLIVFQNQVRMYLQKDLIYSYATKHVMYDALFGSFAKEQNCLILMYENHGFQVLIVHRQFNPKQVYGSNKNTTEVSEDISIPKKTTQFKTYWDKQSDSSSFYKLYERNIQLLKWMTYKEKFTEKMQINSNLKVNSKILGLGPDFILKLAIQNASDNIVQNIKIFVTYNRQSLSLIQMPKQISMLTPQIAYNLSIKVISHSFKNETVDFLNIL